MFWKLNSLVVNKKKKKNKEEEKRVQRQTNQLSLDFISLKVPTETAESYDLIFLSFLKRLFLFSENCKDNVSCAVT